MQLRTLTLRGIPDAVLKALRAAAERNRRSLNAEVLVRLEAGVEDDAVTDGSPRSGRRGAGASAAGREPAVVREPAAPPYEVRRAFEADRAALLESDLRMTPEQRVLLSDQLLDDALHVRRRPNVHVVRAFDTWEDYLAWKRTDFLL